MLVWLKLFPSIRLAQRRLRKLWKKGKLRYVGQAYLDDTMQKVFYCGPLFPSVWVEHEAEITMILLRVLAGEVRRSGVPHDCDALLVINGQRFFLERHRSTHNAKGLRRRLGRLKLLLEQEPDAIILWVCNDNAGIREIHRHMEPILDACLFCTYEEAMTPHEAVWTGRDDRAVALPVHGRAARPQARS